MLTTLFWVLGKVESEGSWVIQLHATSVSTPMMAYRHERSLWGKHPMQREVSYVAFDFLKEKI